MENTLVASRMEADVTTIRRSTRPNLGQSASRYGEWDRDMPVFSAEAYKRNQEDQQDYATSFAHHTSSGRSQVQRNDTDMNENAPSVVESHYSKARTHAGSQVSTKSCKLRQMEVKLAAEEERSQREKELREEELRRGKELREEELRRGKELREEELRRGKELREEELRREKELREEEFRREDELRQMRLQCELLKIAEEEEMRDNVLEHDRNSEVHSRHRVDDWLAATTNGGKKDVPRVNQNLYNSYESIKNKKVESVAENTQVDKFLARQTISRDLPEFDGNPMDWPTFHAMYKTSTAACQFLNVENMTRLMKCLKGAAKDSVRGMMMIPENLEEVMSTLEEMFGKADHIIQSLIWKAKQTVSPKENKLGSIIAYTNSVRNLVITMQHLKCTGHLWNPQLKSELVNKLPDNLKIQWAMESTQIKENNLLDFSDCLTTLSKSVNNIATSYNFEDKRNENKGRYAKDSIHTTSDERIKRKSNAESHCILCDIDGHSIDVCRKFKKETLQGKWNIIKEKRLCFCCLKSGHRIEVCLMKKECGIQGCKKLHNKILHTAEKKNIENRDMITAHTLHTKEILLRILPVTLKGPKGKYETYAMMDEASTGTYIDEKVAEKIGADGHIQPLRTSWFGGVKHDDYNSKSVNLIIVGENGMEYELTNVHTRKNIALPIQSVDVKKMSQKWNHLQSVDVKSIKNATPTILIGSDNYHFIMVREYREGPPNAPVLTKTKLGWLAHGTHVKGRIDNEFTLHVYDNSNDQILHDMVKASFTTEDFGVKETRKLRSKETERAETVLLETTKRVDDRWETGLLWKSNEETLPESYNQALYRLKSTEKKMDRDENFAERYCDKIDDYPSLSNQHDRVEFLSKIMQSNTNMLDTPAIKSEHGF